MCLALLLALLGLGIAPLCDRILNGGVTVSYYLGLTLVLGSVCLFFLNIMAEIRSSRRNARRISIRAKLGLFPVTLLCLYLIAELGSGGWIWMSGLQSEITEFRNRQRFTVTAMKVSHPFLLWTNNPELENVNSLGFLDVERSTEKPPGVIRIACIGASTTEDGYPAILEGFLNSQLAPKQFEIINFANAGWTSAQNIINYELTVRHFQPDYVLIHEGVNDLKVRGYGTYRTDYSHAFQVLTPPPRRADAELIGCSNAYALAKFHYYRIRNLNSGIDIYAAIEKKNVQPIDVNEEEDRIAIGNIEELVNLATMHGAQPILTTIPYSRTNTTWGSFYAEHMRRMNAGVREIAKRKNIFFVDLDAIFGEDESRFIDPVHLTPTAVELKAAALAFELTEHFAAKHAN